MNPKKHKVTRTQKDLARILLIVALAKQKKMQELVEERKLPDPKLSMGIIDTEIDALLDIFAR